MMKDIDIIIPVHNEAESIVRLVQRIDTSLISAAISYRIIFVDDYSTDTSAINIKSLQRYYPITYIKKKGKQGKAYAILEGAEVATSNFVAMIDGDLQYPPEAIPQMYELARTHGMVVANRKKHNTSLARKLVSKTNSFILGKLVMGFDCDAQSGLKVFKREVIEEVNPDNVRPWALDMP